MTTQLTNFPAVAKGPEGKTIEDRVAGFVQCLLSEGYAPIDIAVSLSDAAGAALDGEGDND